MTEFNKVDLFEIISGSVRYIILSTNIPGGGGGGAPSIVVRSVIRNWHD